MPAIPKWAASLRSGAVADAVAGTVAERGLGKTSAVLGFSYAIAEATDSVVPTAILTYSVELPGRHELTIALNGRAICGAPFSLKVRARARARARAPCTCVHVYGPGAPPPPLPDSQSSRPALPPSQPSFTPLLLHTPPSFTSLPPPQPLLLHSPPLPLVHRCSCPLGGPGCRWASPARQRSSTCACDPKAAPSPAAPPAAR